LKTILAKGDLVVLTENPTLELKNFGSMPASEELRANYIAGAKKAFEHALDLLSKMKCDLAFGIPQRFKQTFKDYFGDPEVKVDVGKLKFAQGASPLSTFEQGERRQLTGTETRGVVVRAVLDCVWKGLRTAPVRLYFGGGTIIPNVKAYTNIKVRKDGRVNVHLAIDFFSQHTDKAIKGVNSSRGGVLIHEFTHALAGTVDVGMAMSSGQCKLLTQQGEGALINAQSYAFFVEDTVGF
jgi:hypothetical protein